AAHSQHPVSQALARLTSREGRTGTTWSEVRELPGQGLEALDAQGQRWRLGSAAWALGATIDTLWPEGRVWFASHAAVLGFSFDERLRPESVPTVEALRAMRL